MQLLKIGSLDGDDLSIRVGRKFCSEPEGCVSEDGGPSIRWHESSFDESMQPYAIYVPSAYDSARSWPLVISLHGYSSDHVLNLRRVFGRGNSPDEPDNVAKSYFPQMPEIDFIVASPYGFGSMWYEGCAETDVIDVIVDVCSNYNIDPDRIYLTGLSMGGYGTWRIAARYPDLFAAIAPVCSPTDSWHVLSQSSTLPAFADDIVAAGSPVALARNLLHLPAKVFHGAEDDVVSVHNSREMVHRLREVGAQVEYVEYPEVKHNAWDYTYTDCSIFDWFKDFKRVDRPRTVDFSTPSLRWSSAYWVTILQIYKRPLPADVRADVLVDNVIRIVSQNVQAVMLKLDRAPIDRQSEVTVLWNGVEAYRGVPDSDSIILGDVESGVRKRPGLEGPVGDAFNDRYLLVYGTAGDDSGMVRAGRAAAEEAANTGEWSDIEIPIKPDWDVTPEEILTHNLILIGNATSNDLIAKINNYLPVHFEPGGIKSGRRFVSGKDLGIIVVYPNPLNPEKYVVILGGQSPETIRKAVENRRYAPDYVIFDDSTDFGKSDTVLDWGYFNNSWHFVGCPH